MAEGTAAEPERSLAQDQEEQAEAHAEAQAAGHEPLLKVMIQPTTASVSKFEDGRRIITLTQQGTEYTIPLGPGEAEQLSQELYVSTVAVTTPGEAKAAGIILP